MEKSYERPEQESTTIVLRRGEAKQASREREREDRVGVRMANGGLVGRNVSDDKCGWVVRAFWQACVRRRARVNSYRDYLGSADERAR